MSAHSTADPSSTTHRRRRRRVELDEESALSLQDVIDTATHPDEIINEFKWRACVEINNASDLHSQQRMQHDIALSLAESGRAGNEMEWLFFLCALSHITDMIEQDRRDRETAPTPVVYDPATFEWWW